MHPSKSIIFFTVISGTGYGIFIGLLFNILFIEISYSLNYKLFISLVSFLMIVLGLLSSTLHLGHPERAWRAFSQWKSSWLSREGLISVITFFPMVLFYYFWINNINGYVFLLIILCVFSLLTIFCTGQMYATLKTIPSWNNSLVTPICLIFMFFLGIQELTRSHLQKLCSKLKRQHVMVLMQINLLTGSQLYLTLTEKE